MDKFINENSIKILDSLAEGIYVIDKQQNRVNAQRVDL